MRANFEIWGHEVGESYTPSPEPDDDHIRPTFGSLVSATTELFVQNGLIRIQPPPVESLEDWDLESSANSKKQSKDVLQHISRTINKTHASLKRSRLIHIFYIVSLPLYTVLGALIFTYLDGEYDDRMLEIYENRCKGESRQVLENLRENCLAEGKSVNDCWHQIEDAVKSVDDCFRSKSFEPFPTHSMSNFANSLVYATSVYTTIGYGNIAAETLNCRVATVIYAIIGIPLFFAFLKDMGQLFSVFFIKGWYAAGRLKRRIQDRFSRFRGRLDSNTVTQAPSSNAEEQGKKCCRFSPRYKNARLARVSTESGPVSRVREQRRVFVWAVIFFLIYLISVSGLFCLLEKDWDFFISFYFLFTSVALIGFGDVFPSDPNLVLINFAFIVLGIVLFGMCYFILQEEIREKAFEASRRVRNSIFRQQQRYAGRIKKRLSLNLPNGKTAISSDDVSPSSSDPTSENVHRTNKDRRKSAPNAIKIVVAENNTSV